MKYIGFIKEHNNIKEAIPFEKAIGGEFYEESTLAKIIEYLNSGVLLLSWMGYFTDFRTNGLIAPDSYFTDGIWVWPSHLPYYLKKHPNMILDKDFIEYLSSKQFKMNFENEFLKHKTELEKDFRDKLNG